MNPFAERYKTYTNVDLLRVINTPRDYQPSAIEAAREELALRNLSTDELENAKSELEDEKRELIRKKEKREAIQDSIKEKGNVIPDYINPIQKSKPRSAKLITSIFLVFMLISVLQVVAQYDLAISLFSDSLSEWDFSVVLFLYPLVMTPVSVFLFWRRLKIGWVLFAVFLSSVVAGSLFMLLMYFAAEFLLVALFYGITLWVICSRKVYEVYRINKNTIYITIISSAIITLLTLAIAAF